MHQLGLAQIFGYFRQNVEQKAGAHATQNHLLHAAETEEAKAHGSSQHHHCSQQKWLCQKLMVLQTISGGRKARTFRRADVSRKLPKGHSFGGRKTVAHLRRRQRSRQSEAVLIDGRRIERESPHALEQPVAVLERRFARFDALLEYVVGVESK